MEKDLVSVIIPTYNRGYCLHLTVDSILTQTHQNFEVIIVDDGSTDDTREAVTRRYGHDPRIRYFYQENTGVSGARNTGLRQVRGDFVAFLDSDDFWEPWKLEMQLAVMRKLPEVGMVWTNMIAIDPSGAVVDQKHLRTKYDAYVWYPTLDSLFQGSGAIADIAPQLADIAPGTKYYYGDIFSPMIMGNLVHTSTVLLRRDRMEAVGDFREDLLISGEDYDYHLRTSREGLVAHIDISSILYQIGRPDQLSRPDLKALVAKNFLKTIEPIMAKDRDRITLPQSMIDAMFADAYFWLGEQELDLKNNKEAARAFWKSMHYHPLQLRAIGFLLLATLPPESCDRLRRWYRSTKDLLLNPHAPA